MDFNLIVHQKRISFHFRARSCCIYPFFGAFLRMNIHYWPKKRRGHGRGVQLFILSVYFFPFLMKPGMKENITKEMTRQNTMATAMNGTVCFVTMP